jgi:hypothetical protein
MRIRIISGRIGEPDFEGELVELEYFQGEWHMIVQQPTGRADHPYQKSRCRLPHRPREGYQIITLEQET